MKRKNRILNSLLFIILILNIVPITAQEEEFTSPNPSSREILKNYYSHYLLDPTNDGQDIELNGIRNTEREYFELNDNEFNETPLITEQSSYSLLERYDARISQFYNGKLYLITTRRSSMDDQWISFQIMSKSKDDLAWNNETMVMNISGFSNGISTIRINQEQIFLVMGVVKEDESEGRLYVKRTPLYNLKNLSEVSPLRIDDSGIFRGPIDIVAYHDNVMIIWVDNSSRLLLNRYRIGSWDSTEVITSDVGFFGAINCEIQGNEGIYLVYSDSLNENLYWIFSQDSGSVWSSPSLIYSGSDELNHISLTNTPNWIHLTYSNLDNEKTYYVHFNLSFVESVRELGDFLFDPNDQVRGEVSLTSIHDEVMVAFEDDEGIITVQRSFDEGVTFQPFRTFLSGSAHSPQFDEGMNIFLYAEKDKIIIHEFDAVNWGTIRTGPISPIALTSWNDWGFSYSGFNSCDYLGFKILSDDGLTQIYPTLGFLAVLDKNEGWIEDSFFESIGLFSDDWAGGSGLVDTIRIEIGILRGPETHPFLHSFIMNYSVDYPYIETFRSEHFIILDNLELIGNGLQLAEHQVEGSAILGPIFIEGDSPEILTARGMNITQGSEISFEILRSDRSELVGFSGDNKSKLIVSNENSIILWQDNQIGNIPNDIQKVYLRLDFSSHMVILPRLEFLQLTPSIPPSIEEISILQESIFRGGESQINFKVIDPDQPDNNFKVIFETRAPGNDTWSDKYCSIGIKEGGIWKVIFQPDLNSTVGKYSFRLQVEDIVSATSGWIQVPKIITVNNNLPSSPIITINPVIPRTGETVFLSIEEESKDKETDSEYLTYNITSIRGSEVFYEFNINLTDQVQIPGNVVLKDDIWRIIARSWDGISESNPNEIQFTVVNSAPYTDIIPEVIKITEDKESRIEDFKSFFVDQDSDDLTIMFNHPQNFTLTMDGKDLLVKPEQDFNGEVSLDVIVSDESSTIVYNLLLVVEPVNDLPIWADFNETSVVENDSILIMFDARDKKDDQVVAIETNVEEVVPGLSLEENYWILANGDIWFLTDNSMIGEYTISLTISDGIGFVYDSFILKVINKNNPPKIINIICNDGERVIRKGDLITLSVDASDPDSSWGEEISYVWISSIDGYLGEGQEINVSLSKGYHKITVQVSDHLEETDSQDIYVLVIDQKGNGGLSLITKLLMIFFFSLIIGLAASFAIFLLSRKKRKETTQEDVINSPGGNEGQIFEQNVLTNVTSHEMPQLKESEPIPYASLPPPLPSFPSETEIGSLQNKPPIENPQEGNQWDC